MLTTPRKTWTRASHEHDWPPLKERWMPGALSPTLLPVPHQLWLASCTVLPSIEQASPG